MTKFQKVVVGLGIVVALLFLISSVSTPSTSVGGVYNTVVQQFRAGLKAGTTNQLVISEIGGITTPTSSTIGTDGSGLSNFVEVLSPTADTTLTASQSGSIVNMGVAGLDITLPTVATSEGAYFRFVVSAAVATTNMTIISENDLMEGTLIVAGAVVDCDAENTLNFVIDGENVGDYVELYSNGTNWFIGDSSVLTSAKLTCTS